MYRLASKQSDEPLQGAGMALPHPRNTFFVCKQSIFMELFMTVTHTTRPANANDQGLYRSNKVVRCITPRFLPMLVVALCMTAIAARPASAQVRWRTGEVRRSGKTQAEAIAALSDRSRATARHTVRCRHWIDVNLKMRASTWAHTLATMLILQALMPQSIWTGLMQQPKSRTCRMYGQNGSCIKLWVEGRPPPGRSCHPRKWAGTIRPAVKVLGSQHTFSFTRMCPKRNKPR